MLIKNIPYSSLCENNTNIKDGSPPSLFQHCYIWLAVFVITSLAISSCNDKPTIVGFDMLSDTVNISFLTTNDTTLITGPKAFLYRLPLFNAGDMFLGQTSDLEAISVIRFPTLPDSLDSIPFFNASRIRLYVRADRYVIGDSINNFLSLKVHKIVKLWSPYATWDTLFSADNYNSYVDPQVLGSYSGVVALDDTTATIAIDIDPGYWKYMYDMQFPDSTNINWGIALIPDPSCTVVRKFQGLAVGASPVQPSMMVNYTNRFGAPDSLVFWSAINASFINTTPPETNTIVIRGAVAERTDLYFDVSMIPKNAGINKADLELTVNMDGVQHGNFGADSIIILDLYNTNLDSIDKANPYRAYYASWQAGTDKFDAPNIVSAVEYWLMNSGKGYLELHMQNTEEYRRIDKLSFYGTDYPDSSKRPKLRIVYTQRPKYGPSK
jgi:hypothetical protein